MILAILHIVEPAMTHPALRLLMVPKRGLFIVKSAVLTCSMNDGVSIGALLQIVSIL